jgi:tRNA/rRNA methyltransferase
MAGTDSTRDATLGGPAVVLVQPQLGENIGTTARAMLNFGLTDLRLVEPRDGWPSEKAVAAASRADLGIENARLYPSVAEAVADLHLVYAATARPRDMLKPVVTPSEAAAEMRQHAAKGMSFGVLFGPEKAGLHNDDVALADRILAVPLNPAFASLNLAQAVLVVGYEWFQAGDATPPIALDPGVTRPATQAEFEGFFKHLEDELWASGFLRPPEKAPRMIRNLRNLFRRAGLMEQEIRTLRGVVAALAKGRRGRGEEE